MRFLYFYESFINWIHSRLNNRQFLIFSSMLVGLTAGIAAIILKTAVHYISLLFTNNNQTYSFVFFPLIGILITVFYVQKFRDGKLKKGTANVLRAIIKRSGFIPKDNMFSHVITSAITVGFGGSAGLESPIVVTGSAIGSNYAKTYHIGYKDRVLLLACGAAAGISAAFDAPVAGVLFALEVLLVNVSISAFIPLLIAAAIGTLCSKVILEEGILLSFDLGEAFNYHNVPFYILLGIFTGFISVYYSRSFVFVERFFNSRKTKVYQNVIIGGLTLALLLFLFPSLFGEGYNSIKSLSNADPIALFKNSVLSNYVTNDWILLLLITITMLVKVFATSITINSGGNGGNFAPSLFVGAYFGYVFSHLINRLGITEIPEANFAIVAMAGILTGVFHAPLTGIFLIAEITGGYGLMVPLMLVSAISFTIVKYFEPLSMDAKKLAKEGNIITTTKDRTILSTIKVSNLIEFDFQPVKPDLSLRELVQIISKSNRNVFPVVDKDGMLVGLILLENIREIMFKTELYDQVLVKELMRKPSAVISPDDDTHSIMKKFDETGVWNLPVVDEGKYMGFISKSSLLTKYRKKLISTQI